MRVVMVNLAHEARLRDPEALLAAYRSATGWAEGLVAAGAEVEVVQGFVTDAELVHHGVRYHFVKGAYAPRLLPWRAPGRLIRLVAGLQPDVIHLQSLLFPLAARALRARLPRSAALVAQHHAEGPSPGLRGQLQRWGLAAVDGFFFTGRGTAEPWLEAGIIGTRPVFEIAEGSLQPRVAGTTPVTRLPGDPAVAWVGNLSARKDPLTVLDGFERLLVERPAARLTMIYRRAPLIAAVAERIAASEALAAAVELVGELPHEEVTSRLRGADLFVLGSRAEGSGYALVDALAAGAVPVVTDIPSFRFITAGEVGALWPVGDSEAFAVAARGVLSEPLGPQREKARRLFERRLGFEAIGRAAVAAYDELLAARRAQTTAPPAGGVSARRQRSTS